MGFTTDEITTSVEAVVRSSVRRPYDTLGTRRSDVTFTDTQEAAAGVFLLYRDSPFYILSLAAERIVELLNTQGQVVDSLLSAIQSAGRDATPIKDLTTLSNAHAALVELEGAIGNRTKSFKDIEKVPAFVRFSTNVDKFLNTSGSNVKDAGQIVSTPQEARTIIPNLLTQLKDNQTELIRRVTLLRGARADYAAVNLPSLVAGGVISRARQILSDRIDQLQVLDDTARLAVIRSVVLDLLTQKAVVKQFGSFAGSSDTLSVDGDGSPYSDATHLSTPAFVTSSVFPYGLLSGFTTLDFFLDAVFTAKFVGSVASVATGTLLWEAVFTSGGGFTAALVAIGDVLYVVSGANINSRWVVKTVSDTVITATGDHDVTPAASTNIEVWPSPSASVFLSASPIAKIDGLIAESYVIYRGDSNFADNYRLKFLANSTVIAVNLVPSPTPPGGTALTAAQVVTLINTQAPAQMPAGVSIVAEAFFSPLKYDSVVETSLVSGTTYRFSVLSGQLDGLNVLVGDLISIKSGPNIGRVLTITALDVSSPFTFVDASDGSSLSGIAGSPPFMRMQVQIGANKRKLRLRCSGDSHCVLGETSITILNDPSNNAASILGFGLGVSSKSRSTTPREVTADFSGKTLLASASPAFEESFPTHLRSFPLFPTRIALYKFRGTGDVVATGLNVTVTISTGSFLAEQVEVGNILVLRSGPNPDSEWTVTAVTDTILSATGAVATTTSSQVDFEAGRDVGNTLMAYRTLIINSPSQNQGIYAVASKGPTSLDLELQSLLPIRQNSQLQPILMEGSYGVDYVRFSSVSPTVSSSILVRGSGAATFFTSPTSPLGHGTSPWFHLPSTPRELQVDDLLETYASDYSTPNQSFTVTSVDSALSVIGIDPEMPSEQAWTFSQTIPPPFALLRAGKVLDSSSFEALLQAWLDRPDNQPAFFTDLNRFVNPLLITSNPTAVQVTDAKNRLLDYVSLLTLSGATIRSSPAGDTLESALKSYSVDAIPAIDTLLKTFKEKGADRALDILLEGNFSGFFGLSMDSSSYAGDMLLQLRNMARQDLPIRKVGRAEAQQGRLLAETTDVDYEFTSESTERIPDPPGDLS